MFHLRSLAGQPLAQSRPQTGAIRSALMGEMKRSHCARCVLDPKGLLGNSVGQWQDGRRPSRPRSARVSLDFVGTLFAHRQTHDIAKLAIRTAWAG